MPQHAGATENHRFPNILPLELTVLVSAKEIDRFKTKDNHDTAVPYVCGRMSQNGNGIWKYTVSLAVSVTHCKIAL